MATQIKTEESAISIQIVLLHGYEQDTIGKLRSNLYSKFVKDKDSIILF